MTDNSLPSIENPGTQAQAVEELGVILKTRKARNIFAAVVALVGFALSEVTAIYGIAHAPEWLVIADQAFVPLGTVAAAIWKANVR